MGRPIGTWHGFAGQATVVNALREHCSGAAAKNQPLPHICLAGPSGMGKTAIATCIAKELGTTFLPYFCSPQSKRWQIAKHLTQVRRGDVVFLDEVHQLIPAAQEVLFPAIDNRKVPVVNEDNRIQENEWIEVPEFSVVVATDQPGALVNAFRQRLALRFVLQPYTTAEMRVIVAARASEIKILLSPQACSRIAEAARGVPRRARHLLQSLHTVLEDAGVTVSKTMATAHLASIGIDRDNLTKSDRQYLGVLARRDGCVSLHNLATSLGLDEMSVIRDIEPYLMQMELIAVESRGRSLTDTGKKYVTERRLA
jgi:Holliday junction DNA helicase RuvB